MSKRTKSDTVKKAAVLDALEKTLGVVTPACQMAEISRSTFYKWMSDDEDFAASVNDVGNVALDFAESQLHRMIKEGSVAAIIFLLKTKGKGRGYIERVEHSGKDGEPLNPIGSVIVFGESARPMTVNEKRSSPGYIEGNDIPAGTSLDEID